MDGPIVILTGAGLSAESGLGTFRDADGIWTRYPLEDVATPEGFARDPALVHEFYNARRAGLEAAQPNAAHFALAKLQAQCDARIVTQNVDDLHERAGAEVLHMHGRLRGALCHVCGHRWEAPLMMAPDDPCPKCQAPATRPDVVWFGEIPYQMDRIETWIAEMALFVSIGTSGNVYPAAGFVADAQRRGVPRVELNLEPSEGAALFSQARYGPASEVVPAWVEEILAKRAL